MLVGRVRLINVRSHSDITLGFRPRLNIIHGRNGAGKTSVVEGVLLALQARSPRTFRVTDVIRKGSTYLRAEVQLVADEECEDAQAPPCAEVAFALSSDGTKRCYTNGSPLANMDRWAQLAPLSVFLPDDVRLVKGSPGRRRTFMDALFAKRSVQYREAVSRYGGALAQRNALLQGGTVDAQHKPWEAILAQEGHLLVKLRTEGLAAFARTASGVHRALAARPAELRLVYRTNAADLSVEEYRAALAGLRASDRRLSFTHLGPHRDDVRLVVDGVDLREAGSQGEQRLGLLTLLLAQREWAQGGGARPILLLDDVMSELDAERRRALLAMVVTCGQSIITTTDLHHFTEGELAGANVVEVGGCCG